MDRCLNCMKETASDVCPYCGYDRSAYELQSGVLKPQTHLKGRYVIGRVLGRGGFGITYNGWDAQAGRRVAIKEYFPSGLAVRTEGRNTISAVSSADTHAYKSGVVKFFDEAQILTEFRGVKEIVEIYDFFYENETSYIVMEYIDGENILQIMTRQNYIDTGTAAGIILQLTGSMIKVHERDVLHRDISPSNIIVTGDGGIKLIDFGSARQYTADQQNSMSVILKNGFAPIEQYSRKGNHGPWTDIYGICATFYYMITGKLPEQATDRLMEDTLIPPSKLRADVTPKQEAILLKGLAVKSADRYQSASELKSAIEGAFGISGDPAPDTPEEEQKTTAMDADPEQDPLPEKKKIRFMPFIAALIGAALILLIMLSLAVWRRPAETDADTTAEGSERIESEAALRMTETEPDAATAAETKETMPAGTEQAAAAATGIRLSKTDLTLEKGVTGILAATVEPANAQDRSVTWTTSDPAVASVSEGKVTALTAGTAIITARTSNGKTLTCTVTVPITAVEKVTIEQASVTLNSGEKAALTVTISPENAEDKTATLTSSDPNVVAVDGFTITAMNAGSAAVTAKTSNGKTDTCAVTVKAIQDSDNITNKDPALKPDGADIPVEEKTFVDITGTVFNGNLVSENQEDKFRFTPSVSGRYRFDFNSDNVQSDYMFYMYAANNAQLASTYYSRKGKTVDLIAGEVYSIIIMQYTGTAKYTITIGVPNDPGTISSDNFSGSIRYEDQKDIYSYTAPKTGRYRFDFNSDNVQGDYMFYMYAANKEELASTYYSRKGKTVDLTAGEVYSIIIMQYTGTAKYSITIGVPNDPAIISSDNFSGSIRYKDQVDNYSYTAPKTGSYRFDFNSDNVQGDYMFYMYAANKEELASTYYSRNGKTVDLIAGEVYKIIIIQYIGLLQYEIVITKP